MTPRKTGSSGRVPTACGLGIRDRRRQASDSSSLRQAQRQCPVLLAGVRVLGTGALVSHHTVSANAEAFVAQKPLPQTSEIFECLCPNSLPFPYPHPLPFPTATPLTAEPCGLENSGKGQEVGLSIPPQRHWKTDLCLPSSGTRLPHTVIGLSQGSIELSVLCSSDHPRIHLKQKLCSGNLERVLTF